jgi:hypothetical protein
MEQNFQDRLNNFQLPPPEEVWNKIDQVLEAQEEKRLARKLFYFEVMPPGQVWQKLNFKIGKDKESPAGKRPIRRYIVYTSIAASIILSIVSINLLTGNSNSGTEESLITTPKLKPSNSQLPSKNSEYGVTDSVNRLTGVINSPGHLIAAIHVPAKRNWFSAHKLTLKNIEDRLIGSTSSLETFVPETASRNKEISYEDGMDRYMIYASDDGNAVRLPKKMYDNFACPTNDPLCREKIKTLQQRMVQGSFASDFTGVLDLLSNMDDRK